MSKNKQKYFFNKGILLDTEEQKDGYKAKEEVNIKIIPKFKKDKMIQFTIRLSFDYDIYSLSECIIDLKTFRKLKEESGWEMTMEDLVIELQTYFIESQQNPPPTTIRYLMTPLTSYMYFTQHTLHQALALFTLTFHDCEPEVSYQNAQVRFNDIRNDVETMNIKNREITYQTRFSTVLRIKYRSNRNSM